jgi:hypothetical protein
VKRSITKFVGGVHIGSVLYQIRGNDGMSEFDGHVKWRIIVFIANVYIASLLNE